MTEIKGKSIYPKNEDKIRDFYCLALKNDEEIGRMLGKKEEEIWGKNILIF